MPAREQCFFRKRNRVGRICHFVLVPTMPIWYNESDMGILIERCSVSDAKINYFIRRGQNEG